VTITKMDTKQLKSGQKVGIVTRGKIPQAVIKIVDKVTPTGFVSIGKKRFNPQGWETGVDKLIARYLVDVKEAEKIIQDYSLVEEKFRAEREAWGKTPDGIAEKATISALDTLRQNGWHSDIDGDWDLMESEIRRIIANYLKKYNPIN
jgi:hypothetical protein